MALTPEQLVLRKTGIGGSEIAAVLGLSPYSTPLDVWRSKVEGYVQSDKWKFRRGRLLEPVVAQIYAEETGATLREVGTLRHPTKSIAVATPDRIARLQDERLLEIKTAHSRTWQDWGPSGTDEAPQHYLLQVAWTMAVADLPKADLAVLIGGDDFRVYHFERDPELEGYLFEAAEKFWRDHVETKIPPRIDGSESAARWLAEKFPREKEPLFQATENIAHMVATLREYELQAEAASNRCEGVKNHLKQVIGDAAGIEGLFGKITWKKSKDGERVDWETVAKAVGVSQELIRQHTTIKPGPRVFRATWRDAK